MSNEPIGKHPDFAWVEIPTDIVKELIDLQSNGFGEISITIEAGKVTRWKTNKSVKPQNSALTIIRRLDK